MTTSQMITDTIRSIAADSVTEAIAQGYDGERAEYEQTQNDCDYIVREIEQRFGRKPTEQEWRDAGFAWIGDRHYAN